MWKHSGHGIRLFSFVLRIRSFQICCQKWHLLWVFIAMLAILYLLLDEVCCSNNRQVLICVLMSKNAFIKVFPLWICPFWIDFAFFLIFCYWISVHHIYVLLDWPRYFKTCPGHKGRSSLKLRGFTVCFMWFFLHFLLSDLCQHSLKTLKLDLVSEMQSHKRNNADFVYAKWGIVIQTA